MNNFLLSLASCLAKTVGAMCAWNYLIAPSLHLPQLTLVAIAGMSMMASLVLFDLEQALPRESKRERYIAGIIGGHLVAAASVVCGWMIR